MKVKIIRWDKMNNSGYITPELFRAIYNSKYGICYLSEYKNKKKKKFIDNTNVLLEAGFMHSKNHNIRGNNSKWILIREKNTEEKMIFDLNNIRRIDIKRKNEKIKEEEFIKKLEESLKEIYDL